MYNHKINTKFGIFQFGWSMDKSWIAGKFENPTLAKEVYTCNPYSGKYNFWGAGKDYTPLNKLMNFLDDLKKHNNLGLSDFQQFLADQINSVMEVKLYWYYKNMDSVDRTYLYELTCKRACLNPKSKDVRKAFNFLFTA